MALKTEDTITYISYFLCLMQVCSMLIPFQLQGQLGGNFPLECLQDDVFMAFPSTAIWSSSGAKAICETLKNIDTLFGADNLPTKWEQQNLENFVDTGEYLIILKSYNVIHVLLLGNPACRCVNVQILIKHAQDIWMSV
uniref:Uncharacterized protein n=1 Tax=Hucho hucho TaxID=62062 RepID=A0A4W5JQ77_9TELE